MDGSSEGTLEREGIKATSQTILHFPHSYASTIQGAEVGEPELTQKQTSSKPVQIAQVRKSTGQCNFLIEIQDGLSPSDGELSYTFSYGTLRSFYMTQEEMKAAHAQYEFSTYLITAPTEFLELEIQLPPKYSVKCYLGCYVGDNLFLNDSELQRRNGEKCFESLPRGARIKIIKPVIGFRYGIYWVPMQSQRYEELRGISQDK